jgi:membrane fusion protein, multidrug efflux system
LDAEIRDLESKLGPVEEKSTPVTTMVTKVQPFRHMIEVKGSVDSRSTISVAPQMSGRIVRLAVSNGQTVKQGQLLFELDAEVVKRSWEEVETQLDFARTIFDKQKRIYEQKAGSEVQYLQAKNNVEALEKRRDVLKEQLSLSRITAPTSGTIDELRPNLGELVMAGMPVLTIVNTSDMRVVVDLAEAYINTVDAGDEVTIIFPELSDTVRTRISTVAKTINTFNRTFRVEIPLKSHSPKLRPNTTCNVRINDQTLKDAIAIPLASVVREDGKEFVFVVDDKGRARKKPIVTDLVSSANVLVVSGLGTDETIIIRGVQQVADGQAVAIID